MLPLPVTICLTGLFALMLTALSLTVSLRRKELGLALGDGDDQVLRRRIRAHGNFIENAPMCILLVLALEAVLATSDTIWWVALVLFVARALHAIGTLARNRTLIIPGVLMQHLTFLVCGLWLLIQTISHVSTSM